MSYLVSAVSTAWGMIANSAAAINPFGAAASATEESTAAAAPSTTSVRADIPGDSPPRDLRKFASIQLILKKTSLSATEIAVLNNLYPPDVSYAQIFRATLVALNCGIASEDNATLKDIGRHGVLLPNNFHDGLLIFSRNRPLVSTNPGEIDREKALKCLKALMNEVWEQIKLVGTAKAKMRDYERYTNFIRYYCRFLTRSVEWDPIDNTLKSKEDSDFYLAFLKVLSEKGGFISQYIQSHLWQTIGDAKDDELTLQQAEFIAALLQLEEGVPLLQEAFSFWAETYDAAIRKKTGNAAEIVERFQVFSRAFQILFRKEFDSSALPVKKAPYLCHFIHEEKRASLARILNPSLRENSKWQALVKAAGLDAELCPISASAASAAGAAGGAGASAS